MQAVKSLNSNPSIDLLRSQENVRAVWRILQVLRWVDLVASFSGAPQVFVITKEGQFLTPVQAAKEVAQREHKKQSETFKS